MSFALLISKEYNFRPDGLLLIHYASYHIASQRSGEKFARKSCRARPCERTWSGIGLSDSGESRESDYMTIGDKEIITPACSVYLFTDMYEGSIRRAIMAQDDTTRAIFPSRFVFVSDLILLSETRGWRTAIPWTWKINFFHKRRGEATIFPRGRFNSRMHIV